MPGAAIAAGSLIGHMGAGDGGRRPRLAFAIRPAGAGAGIDPAPILAGWRLLGTSTLAAARPAGAVGSEPTLGQVLLLGKDALATRVLEDPRIDIYACGRADVRAGLIDRRVLATLELLADSGLHPTVTSLECGHSRLTTSGNVSQHWVGSAVDIAAVNGIPIAGHQGPGSIAERTVQRLLTLQGAMRPDQIISLMTFAGASNAFAMADHDDHVHVGWALAAGLGGGDGWAADAMLGRRAWQDVADRLSAIANPEVLEAPSRYALSAARGG